VNSKLKYPDLMVEVEADTPEQAFEATKANADRVMLDNFTPALVKTTVSEIKSISDIEIEISGGVNVGNIIDYAPYADFISLSSLTMAAPPVDFTLHVI
jgi:nicotinate-nucleotide pyrophosphorylase (carboxylating)